MASVAVVDVLQYLLAILMREIDVDIGDLVAFFAEETLEEQIAGNRIDRRDAERVAHRRVRGRTAALSEHAQFARFARDIPHHEEVTREIHPRDDAQLVLELPFDFRGERPAVTLARTRIHERAQIGVMARFPFGDREIRKLPGEFFEPKRAPLRDRDGILNRQRVRVEQARHLLGRLEHVLRVRPQERAGGVQRSLVFHAREHVAQPGILTIDVRDAVGRNVRHAEPLRELHQCLHERAVFGP